jgi:zincin-like metallopeptidase toxin 3 of polymorphic toxin system
MFLDPDDAKTYPKCLAFIMKIDSNLKKEPKLLKAFLDTCKDEDQPTPPAVVEKIARQQALKYGAGPRIKVDQGMVHALSGGVVGDACGWNNGISNALNNRNPVFIEMTSFWFDALEFGVDPVRAGDRLRRTLLHELIHWVRDATRASETIQVGGYFRGEAVECGHLFEERAYGSRNVCTEDEIFDALTSFRKRPVKETSP